MAGVYKLEITETEADLKQFLRTQKTASDKERVQLLSLLKTKLATTIQSAAALLGRHRVTVQEWLRLYRSGGLEVLLKHTPRSGRQQSIPHNCTGCTQQTPTPTGRIRERWRELPVVRVSTRYQCPLQNRKAVSFSYPIFDLRLSKVSPSKQNRSF